jgi:RNA polymerase sigma factor (sigma-70 family)
MSDQEVFERLKAGDQEAFGLVYQRLKKEFSPFFLKKYRFLQETVEDLFHECAEVFLANVRNNKIEKLSSIAAYLVGVGKNIVNTRIKSPSFFLQELDDTMTQRYEAVLGPEIDPEDIEHRIHLMERCMELLGEPCRTLIKLSETSDLSMEEISQITGHKNADSAKTQKYKCLKRLRDIIKKEENSLNYA